MSARRVPCSLEHLASCYCLEPQLWIKDPEPQREQEGEGSESKKEEERDTRGEDGPNLCVSTNCL